MRAFFSRHPIATFVGLVYPLSWYSWLLGVADRIGSTGLNPLGPLAAALITTWLAGGWPRFREWIAHFARFRGGVLPYLAAPLLPAALCVAAVAIHVALGAAAPTPDQLRAAPALVEQFVFVFLFVGLGEEPGWRGYLTPELQKRMSPIAAALALGIVWAIWHAPLFRSEIDPELIGPFLVNVFAGAVVLAWLRNISEAVWPAMIAHATVNTIGAGFLFTFYDGAELTRLWWVNAAVWAAAAAVLAVVTRGGLGFRQAATSPAATRPVPA